MHKADRVIEAAAAATPPWLSDTESSGGMYTLTLTRGDESMVIVWHEESLALVHPLTYALSGVREVKLRNVSAAIKVLAEKPSYKVGRSRPTGVQRVQADGEPLGEVYLPFDPAVDDDRTIVKALVGKVLVWRAVMTGEYIEARVPARERVEVPDGKGGKKVVLRTNPNIYISTTSAGKRVLTFPAVNEQFRSCYLDGLVQVR